MPLYPVSAQIAGEQIDRIIKENGEITPQLLLDNSRSEDAPLHCCFEWNDDVAAERYRLYQSRKIIQNITISQDTSSGEPVLARAFVSTSKNPEKGRFVPLNVALNNEATRQQVLENAYAELKSFKNKYETLLNISELFKSFMEKENIA